MVWSRHGKGMFGKAVDGNQRVAIETTDVKSFGERIHRHRIDRFRTIHHQTNAAEVKVLQFLIGNLILAKAVLISKVWRTADGC